MGVQINSKKRLNLSQQVEDALIKSSGGNSEEPGNVPELAKDLTKSIVDWITKQEFTITEMKAAVKIDSIQLIGAGLEVVSNGAVGGPGGSPIAPLTVIGTVAPKQELVDGSNIVSLGHAYIGKSIQHPVGSDTVEEYNTFTTVRLDKDRLSDVGVEIT